jgi:hypothetical protein
MPSNLAPRDRTLVRVHAVRDVVREAELLLRSFALRGCHNARHEIAVRPATTQRFRIVLQSTVGWNRDMWTGCLQQLRRVPARQSAPARQHGAGLDREAIRALGIVGFGAASRGRTTQDAGDERGARDHEATLPAAPQRWLAGVWRVSGGCHPLVVNATRSSSLHPRRQAGLDHLVDQGRGELVVRATPNPDVDVGFNMKDVAIRPARLRGPTCSTPSATPTACARSGSARDLGGCPDRVRRRPLPLVLQEAYCGASSPRPMSRPPRIGRRVPHRQQRTATL